MADLFLPSNLAPSAVEWRLIDTTAAFSSPLNGTVRTVSRPGAQRWACSLHYGSVRTSERAQLLALVAALRGKENRLWLGDPTITRRGSIGASELLTNGTFGSGTTGWSVSNANIVLSAADRVLRSTRASVAGDTSIRAPAATTVNGVTYAARALVLAGRGAMDYRLRLGTSAGASDIATDAADQTTAGLRTATGVATGTATHFSILDGVTGRSIGDFMEFAYASMARCALVSGASQSGSAILIDALPASTDGLLEIGDMFEINGELKRATSRLNTDNSGAGYAQFEPAIRQTLADNAPVIFNDPMGKFLLNADEVLWPTRPGLFSDFTLDLVEAVGN